jgi:hypothetical protein
MREMVMSKQAMRQASRRSALDAQAALRKESVSTGNAGLRFGGRCADRVGEGDGAVHDPEGADREALLTITDDENQSVREASGGCGSCVTMREVTRLRRLADRPAASGIRRSHA